MLAMITVVAVAVGMGALALSFTVIAAGWRHNREASEQLRATDWRRIRHRSEPV